MQLKEDCRILTNELRKENAFFWIGTVGSLGSGFFLGLTGSQESGIALVVSWGMAAGSNIRRLQREYDMFTFDGADFRSLATGLRFQLGRVRGDFTPFLSKSDQTKPASDALNVPYPAQGATRGGSYKLPKSFSGPRY